MLSSYIDISERKKFEETIVNLNNELVLNLSKLEEANKELESFSYSVSHDLRAPLRAINGFSLILTQDYHDKLDEEGVDHLKRIAKNAQKMGTLIDDLLDFSGIGRKELQKNQVNMEEIIHHLIADEKANAGNRNIEFKLHKLQSALADASLIRQVWVNLISNAVKYTMKEENAIIEIGSTQEDEQIVYYVRDNGTGFDMQYYDKLFGVFQRLHKESEFLGTGVGLAIVQRIVTRHGGRVWAEGILGKRATFYFSLP